MEFRASQTEVADLIESQPATLLAWPMGAGKTRATLLAVMRCKLMGVGPTLIVGTTRVILDQHVWENEGFPLNFTIVHGKRKVDWTADVFLTTFDSLHTERVQEVMRLCRVLVLDELSFLKAWGRRMKAIKKHYGTWDHCVGLTGTPIGQNHQNLFYQIQALDGGATWGMNKTTWLKRNFTKGFDGFSWDVNRPEALAADIESITHAVDGPDLPPIVDQLIDVPMHTKQQRIYREMKEDLITEIEAGEIVAANAAVASSKLRQIASGFMYVEDEPTELLSNDREFAVGELIDVIAAPVICWYQFTHERDWLMQMEGATNSVTDWLNDGGILVLHPQSGGHGLNLQTGGRHEIWVSLPWSLEQWLQARARLARPGQVAESIISHIVVGSPIERRMFAALNMMEDVEKDFIGMLKAA